VVLRDTFEEELEEFPATLGKFLGWCKRRWGARVGALQSLVDGGSRSVADTQISPFI
jgi:hypothetical protein